MDSSSLKQLLQADIAGQNALWRPSHPTFGAPRGFTDQEWSRATGCWYRSWSSFASLVQRGPTSANRSWLGPERSGPPEDGDQCLYLYWGPQRFEVDVEEAELLREAADLYAELSMTCRIAMIKGEEIPFRAAFDETLEFLKQATAQLRLGHRDLPN